MRKSNQDANVEEPSPARLRCAIYTRKSTEEGLDQEFNSLDAQREAAEAFIQSQRREGWIVLPQFYDDGGCHRSTAMVRLYIREGSLFSENAAAGFFLPAPLQIVRHHPRCGWFLHRLS